MANRRDDNHRNDDDEVDDLALTRSEFHKFRKEIQQLRDKNQHFHEENQQELHKIH